MPIEDKKKEPMIDVGEEEGAEVTLDNNEQTKAVAGEKKEEKIEVIQEEEKPVVEAKVEKPVEKKDELEEYSEGVKKRIAKLTQKMREAERQREEAVSYAQSVKREKDQIESRILKTDERYVSEFETRVTSSLANAKIALKSAIDSQDVDGQVNAQQQIAELTMEAARLRTMKVAQEDSVARQKEVNITPQQTTQTARVDPKAEDWASKNNWFGQDSAMTYTAFDLHKKLVEEEGIDPKSDEYYEEIDKRIRLEFPHKFATKEITTTTERAKPAQTVASANRPSQSGRKRTVKLTPSHRASETRTKTDRPKVWTPPSSLDAPPAPDGFRHRWIRAESVGFDDTKNVSGKLRSGWEFVRADEYPDSNYPQVKDGKYAGVIGVGGLVLARIPEEIAKSREEYFAKRTQDREEAIANDPFKEQHPSMPISKDRQTRVTFGGSKKN